MAASEDAELDTAPVSANDSGNNITASFYQVLTLPASCLLVRLAAVVSPARPI